MNKTKTAIITGASSGMGKALALHLDKLNYNLLLISKTESRLLELKKLVQNEHDYAAIDVANQKQVQDTVNQFLQKHGQIDLLFNSAGYAEYGTSTLEESGLRKMLDTNLMGVFNLIQAVLPNMKQKNYGYIITVASHGGKQARAPLGGYAASKFAVVGFCESLYKELSDTGISVTTLCPSTVDTAMTEHINSPRDLMIKTDDIVKTVDFILSLSSSVGIKEIMLQCKARIAQHEKY